MTNTDDGSRAHSAHGSGDVRANTPETFANLTHLPHLPHLPKSSSGYELHPTSSTSTRTSATVDGSIRPIEDTRPLRSVEAIRADLEHPHTAALTALHSTTIGDGPIGRLLRDVEPLLDRLEPVEAVIEEARKVSPSGSMVVYVADLERAVRAALAASPTPAGGERREPDIETAKVLCLLTLRTVPSTDTTLAAQRVAIGVLDALGIEWDRDDYLRRLAAAQPPTPTGPEPAKCEDCGWPWPLPGRPPTGAECDSCGGDLVPAIPEPTEETRP